MLMPKEALSSLFVQKKMKEAKTGLSRGPPQQKGRLSLINSKILEAQAGRNIVK